MGFFTRVPSVDPEQVADRLRNKEAVVVDVRMRGEWKAGRIRGAVHVPLHELSARIGGMPHDRTLITVCRSGHRSAVAARKLKRAGYEVENLRGGMTRWARVGLPLEPANGRVL
ncbi:MAG: rhodanese-like domain-containing protein [Gaiellaceae bacterium]|jgi:rhodanese-related sulfurtransferase